jgi:GDP-D-mannose dehydratase
MRCNDYYEDLVSKIYDPKKVIIIDGADQTTLNPIYKKHLYFKRELIDKHPNLCLIEVDLTDLSSLINLLKKCNPNEFYNLAAQSFVASSFEPIANV